MFIKNEQRRLSYQMLVFDEVVNRGSFTAAAEALGHTKSAVSQYVSQLETGLGVRLLNRSTRQLNLTAAGKKLAKRSEQLVDLLSATLDEMQSLEHVPTGRVSITAPHAFETSLVTPIVAELCSEYPKLTPELVFTDERLDLLEHKLDIAISVGPQKDSNYQAIPIGKLDSILVASPRYLARVGEIRSEHLSEQTLVILPWQNGATLKAKQGTEISYTSDQSLRVNTSISAINSVKSGVGIGLIPSIFVQDELEAGMLQRILPEFEGEVRVVYALHSYQKQLPLVMRRFVERLKLEFQQQHKMRIK
ncbi:transcriptional regulator [Shewanella psychrophila]|uniref:Transcriptional regulator n=1 Tax=Shewanella psychrophila TaxID=225848 RepID=A0A1S6HS94_9GAMM|nr:LysR family transcriptional regulator [Shewanella psychrophila]AQS38389.1 transcriptional regulator [Shewanella psychrophila]